MISDWLEAVSSSKNLRLALKTGPFGIVKDHGPALVQDH